ncbi:MAG: DUF6265 family protein [bacterium]|nr:DUF6265 family protein [bacterium]
MDLRTSLLAMIVMLGALGTVRQASGATVSLPQGSELEALAGEWLYFEDRTEGRPIEKHGPPMSMRFAFRLEDGAVVMVRARREERIPIDGSVHEVPKSGRVSRYRGTWKDGVLTYDMESVRASDNERTLLIRRTFRRTPDGLEIRVSTNGGAESIARYRHKEDIAPATPIKGAIADLAWLSGAWVGTRNKRSIEERWSPPKGGAMLGVARTVTSAGKMSSFEFLRIVERDGSLVYIAQPGGKSPTEFVLTEIGKARVVFKNTRHSFPQRIEYAVSPGGALTALIGFANGGNYQPFEFTREDG